MSSRSGSPRRHFLPWNGPLLPQAVAWLARTWDGDGPLDLAATLVVVPTRQSGRRLREALAGHAAGRGKAVFPPRIQTPEALLTQGAAGPTVASPLEARLAWADVLLGLDFSTVAEVFPVEPSQVDFGWAWRLAENFVRLQIQLAEAGLAFSDVASLADDFPEVGRWRQLAALEQAQRDRIAEAGRREPHAARREFARDPAAPVGVTRVVLLAAPDPMPLSLDVLKKWAMTLPVDVVIFAPAEEAGTFDDWGRPRPDAWVQRRIALPDFERRVHVCADPAAEAAQMALLARRYGPGADGLVATGLADPEVRPFLENELSRAGLAGYNPEGRGRRGEALHGLLVALAGLVRDAPFDAVAALARCPDFLAALVARGHGSVSAARWLAELDVLRARFLPADLAAAQRVASRLDGKEIETGLAFIAELHRVLATGTFPEAAVATLGLIFESRRFDLANGADALTVDAAAAWRKSMQACAEASRAFTTPKPSEWWDMAIGMFGETLRTEDKPPGALDLQGWLELLWEDAPHLVVAGLNEGLLPEAIVGDAFLPDGLREKLGLKTNAGRFARDAYLLQAISAWRASAAGRCQLDLLLGRTSAVGDPLRPSRLLLRCAETELPARIAFLFRSVGSSRGNLPWTRAWQLVARREPPPASIAVTGLRAWLACPFRFYLSHVRRLEPVEPGKSELDARDFGTLCHAALEAMAREEPLAGCTDQAVLCDFLLAKLDAAARDRFGSSLTLPLVIQLESARQRLARAAVVQARERAAGWVIARAESRFVLQLAGLSVRGTIDRIDRHEATGAWRVLDYKTTDTAVPPHQAHLRPWRAGDEQLPAWMRVAVAGREQVWADLQLPLYCQALAEQTPGADITTGYFNLPKAVGETGIANWAGLTPELREAARACAEGVAAAIRAGEFWPPAELPAERDPFAALFHHGAAASVTWTKAEA